MHVAFEDLDFTVHERSLVKQARVFFPNGYGASVIQGTYTYGGRDGLYEMAILKGGPDDWSLTYDTPITDDVLGYLSEIEVSSYLKEICELEDCNSIVSK